MIRIDSEEPDKALLTLVAIEKQNPGTYDATDKVVITITPYRKALWWDPWTTIEVDYTDAVQRIIKVSKGKDYREWKNDDISFDEIANFIFEPQCIYSEFYRFFTDYIRYTHYIRNLNVHITNGYYSAKVTSKVVGKIPGPVEDDVGVTDILDMDLYFTLDDTDEYCEKIDGLFEELQEKAKDYIKNNLHPRGKITFL